MNLNIRYPSISFGDTEEQLRDIRSYLYQLTDTLNACDTSALAIFSEVNEAIAAGSLDSGDGVPSNETARRMREYASLRDLIIKTADYAASQSESIDFSMAGKYVAISDFGTYFQNATVDIQGTPYNITQIYNYAAGIDTYAHGVEDYAEDIDAVNTAYRVTQESYIKTGLLYYDESGVNPQPVYGIAVGNIYGQFAVYIKTADVAINPAKTYYTRSPSEPYTYTAVENPDASQLGSYYEQTVSHETGQINTTFTADEIAFWSGGTKLAYMTSSALYFPNANITGGTIAIGNNFAVDSSGNVTASNIAATGGSIAGWTIAPYRLYSGSGDSRVELNSAANSTGSSNYEYAFWAGAESPANAEFSVKKNGDIKATSGLIGAWMINGNSLYNTNSSGQQGSIYLNGRTGTIYGATVSAGHISGGDINIGTGTFAVDSTGHVEASSMTLLSPSLSALKLVGGCLSIYNLITDTLPEGYIGLAGGSASGVGTSGIGIFGMAAEAVVTNGGAALKYGNGNIEVSAYDTGAHIRYSTSIQVSVTSAGVSLKGKVLLTSDTYGSTLPSISSGQASANTGRIFFKTA